MRQVHTINEDYEHYRRRKHGNSATMLAIGLILFMLGLVMLTKGGSISYSIGFILVGAGIFYLGIKERKSEERRSFAP